MPEMKLMQKLTMYVNATLMCFVVFTMAFYQHYGIHYMVYHSIPTLACYMVFFVMIHKGMLFQYVAAVYVVITIYMAAGNLCLGYTAGFHLYCMSLVPLSFYLVYMAQKLRLPKTNPLIVSLGLIGVDLCTSVYVVLRGPVYEITAPVACACMVINSLTIFFGLIVYAGFMLRLVNHSEDKLTEMANTDRLTGLSNRNYMLAHLNDPGRENSAGQWLAIADVDNFKRINDTYGHSCGDYVLVEIARAMREVCQGCTVCRWGGEEFLIASDTGDARPLLLEQLRQRVQQTPFSYQGHDFVVTVTIGVSAYQSGTPLDGWIRDADDKLYEGKTGKKNCVIS